MIFFILIVPGFSKKHPFPTSPAITGGKLIKIKSKANDTFVSEISRFPTVIISKNGGSYKATVQLSTFHDVIVKYILEPDGATSFISSWSTPQKEHMRIFSNLQEGKKYNIRFLMTYSIYENKPKTYYSPNPLIIVPPNNLTDVSNSSIFISKPHDHLESDFGVKNLKNIDLGNSVVRKKIRMMGIERNKIQRNAKIWEYAATGSTADLNKCVEISVNAPKIDGDKIKGIKKKLIELVGNSGGNPIPVPDNTSAGSNASIFAISTLRKAMLDKNNDGVSDIDDNKIIRFPDNKVEGDGAYVDKEPEFIFNKIKNGNYLDFNDFVKKAGSRRYEITRQYMQPGVLPTDPPTYFSVTVIEYYPLKIAVDYDNVPGAPGNIRYIELWRYLWGEMYKASLIDEVQTSPLIPSKETSVMAVPLEDEFNANTIQIKPLSYP